MNISMGAKVRNTILNYAKGWEKFPNLRCLQV